MLSSKPTSKHRTFPFPLAGFSLSVFSSLALPSLTFPVSQIQATPCVWKWAPWEKLCRALPDKKLQRVLSLPLHSLRLWKHRLTHKPPLPTNLNIKLQLGGCSWQRMTQGGMTRLTRLKECHKMSPDNINPPGACSFPEEGCQGGKRAPLLTPWQVASDCVRDPELSSLNLWRVVEKQLMKAREAAGRQLWRQMLEHHRTICNPTKIMALNYPSLALVH